MTPKAALRKLESLRLNLGAETAAEKVAAFRVLARGRLASARDVLRLHEAACFARAYPGDARVLRSAEAILRTFHRRADLMRHAEALASSGIAGTAIHYRFFWSTARWLAARFPRRLVLDWSSGEFDDRLTAAWPLLLTPPEAEAVKRADLAPRVAIERLRSRSETDAEFLLRRLEELPGGERVREATHDALDPAYRLEGAREPSRTSARLVGAPVVLRSSPPVRGRPDLHRALRRPPREVRDLPPREGRAIVHLAREAMVTRSRDLDAFAQGDPRDVRIVDDGDGLSFALIGVVPERRLFLPAVYGALTLRNGVPIGYVQIDVLFRNAEMSYNTFATYRGAEAGFVFSRLLAVTRHLFGVSGFSIEPYQLGRGNQEGIESGAWWFYAHCGFRPRVAAVARLAARELARKRRNPAYRSSAAMLGRLAEAHLHWPARSADETSVTPIDRIGLAIAPHARQKDAAARAAHRFGVRSLAGWTSDEKLWWNRWAPLLAAIPGVERWPQHDRAATVRVVRTKASRREGDYARLFDAHPRLRHAILALARTIDGPDAGRVV